MLTVNERRVSSHRYAMYDFPCTSHEGWTSPLLSLLDKGATADSKIEDVITVIKNKREDASSL
jgi:hypothetical protein